jgi:hypothetical protein
MKYMFSNSEILIRDCSFPGIFEERSVVLHQITSCSQAAL